MEKTKPKLTNEQEQYLRDYESRYGRDLALKMRSIMESKVVDVEESVKITREKEIEETLGILRNQEIQKIAELLRPISIEIEESRRMIDQKKTWLGSAVHDIETFANKKISDLAFESKGEIRQLIDEKMMEFSEITEKQTEIEDLFDKVIEKLEQLAKKKKSEKN